MIKFNKIKWYNTGRIFDTVWFCMFVPFTFTLVRDLHKIRLCISLHVVFGSSPGIEVRNFRFLHIVASKSFTLFITALIPTFIFKYLGRHQNKRYYRAPRAWECHLIDGLTLHPLNTINTVQYLLLHVNTDCYQAARRQPASGTLRCATGNLWEPLCFQLHSFQNSQSAWYPPLLSYTCVGDGEFRAS